MCENELQCIICSDIHMSHNDNSRNVSHTFLIDHNLSGPGRSHAQAAKQHLLLISRPPARWATGFSGDLQHNYLLLYIMFCFCNVCTIVLEINILLLLLLMCWSTLLTTTTNLRKTQLGNCYIEDSSEHCPRMIVRGSRRW